MWIFTRFGFYSIACANKSDTNEIDPNVVMVLARVKKHLKNLNNRNKKRVQKSVHSSALRCNLPPLL
jgi:hypothetical protein